MTNAELLKMLADSNSLDAAALDKLKKSAELSGRPAEDILHEWHLIDDDRIAQLKADILGIPFQKIDTAVLTPEILGLVPEETAKRYGIIPLEKRDRLLIAGMLNPDDPKAQEALKFIAGRAQ